MATSKKVNKHKEGKKHSKHPASLLERKETRAAYAMLSFSYLLYVIFIIVPVFVTVYYSFTNYDLTSNYQVTGLTNYKQLFNDKVFIRSFFNTIYYVVLTVAPKIFLGLILAVMFNKKLVGRSFFRFSFYVPNITNVAAISVVWLMIFDPNIGYLNNLLGKMGLARQDWLFSPVLAMPCVAFVSIWGGLGYCMLIYTSALQSVPKELYEAARVDGASGLRQFFKITIPLVAPTTFFLIVTNVVRAFSVFTEVNLLTGGGPMNSTTTMFHQIYNNAFQNFRIGYSCAQAVVLILITLAITALNMRMDREQNYV